MNKGRLLLIVLGLAAITVAAYGRATTAGFLYYDDDDHVYANRFVTSEKYSDILKFWKEPYLGLYIPLTYTVWSIEAKSFRRLSRQAALDPRVFHATNVLVHVLTVLAVFGILMKIGTYPFAAVCGALLFALHPLQVESVAWISELKGLLGGFFSLTSLLLYLHAITIRPDARSRTKKSILYLGAVLVSILGLLSKPSTVVTPLIAAICAIFMYNRSWKQTALEIFPWLVVVIPIIVYTADSQSNQIIDLIPPLASRLLIAGDAIAFYTYKLLVPFPLAIDYGRFPQAVLQSPWIWLTGTLPSVVVLGVVLAGLNYRMKPQIGALMIFITALLPVLGIKPFDFQHISTVADRYVYIALLGPSLMVCLLLARYRSAGVKAFALGVIAVLFVLTSQQTRLWQNNETLLAHTLSVNPRSLVYYKCMLVKAEKEGDLDGLADGCRKILAVNNNSSFHNLLGFTLQRQGKPGEARREFLESLRINPRRLNTYALLGALCLSEGDPLGAARYANALLKRDRFNARAYNLLGIAYQMQGRQREAIEHLLIAKTLEPDQMIYYESLGYLYASCGDMQKAIATYKEALEHDPDNADMQRLLAQALNNAPKPGALGGARP